MNEIKNDIILYAKGLGISLSESQAEKLTQFISLLKKWNDAYNLTAITDDREILQKHLLDSLSIISFLKGSEILDVGTGAGFPGLPIAIINPDVNMYLVDSSGKKVRFLNQVILSLQLPNVRAVHSRIENWRTDRFFDTIVTRAFSDVATTLKLVDHLWKSGGQVLFMKGPNFESELSDISSQYKTDTIPVHVPELKAGRYLIRVTY